jgi:hypothetical protein
MTLQPRVPECADEIKAVIVSEYEDDVAASRLRVDSRSVDQCGRSGLQKRASVQHEVRIVSAAAKPVIRGQTQQHDHKAWPGCRGAICEEHE